MLAGTISESKQKNVNLTHVYFLLRPSGGTDLISFQVLICNVSQDAVFSDVMTPLIIS